MMRNENITGGFKKLKQDLAGMTLQEKAEHIWTYYRSWVIVAVAIVMVISILCSSFINLTTTNLVSGVSINVVLQDDGKAYITDGLKEILKTGSGRQEVYFETSYANITQNFEETYYLQQNLMALIAGQDVDFLLVDQAGMDLVLSQNPFMDLREFFTQEEMADLKIDNVKISESAEAVPMLVDITDWPIVKNNGANSKFYFVVIANSPRLDAVKVAFQHLRNYGK